MWAVSACFGVRIHPHPRPEMLTSVSPWFAASPRVQLRHMAATVAEVVEDEDAGAEAGGHGAKPTVAEKPITFLYKLRYGQAISRRRSAPVCHVSINVLQR